MLGNFDAHAHAMWFMEVFELLTVDSDDDIYCNYIIAHMKTAKVYK